MMVAIKWCIETPNKARHMGPHCYIRNSLYTLYIFFTYTLYTPRMLFSRIFLQICLFVLSLYTVGWTVTLPCEISVQAPVVCVNSHYRVRGKSVACVQNRIMRFRDMAV